jgi:DNA-directed RNA polymerase subunit E"
MTEKACKACRFISKGPTCPACGNAKLTDRWSGFIYIVNPETSDVAKRLGFKVPGKYAAKIKE